MLDTLTTTRSALERLASGFEAGTLTGEQAVRMVGEFGVIRRLTRRADRPSGEAGRRDVCARGDWSA